MLLSSAIVIVDAVVIEVGVAVPGMAGMRVVAVEATLCSVTDDMLDCSTSDGAAIIWISAAEYGKEGKIGYEYSSLHHAWLTTNYCFMN